MSTKARVVAIALSLMAVGVCIAAVACLGACGGPPLIGGSGHGVGNLHPTVVPGPNYHAILNWFAFVCTALAIVSLVVHAWVPFPISTTGALILCAVGCWVLDWFLINLFWVIVLVAVVAGLVYLWHLYGGVTNWKDGKRGWLLNLLERARLVAPPAPPST